MLKKVTKRVLIYDIIVICIVMAGFISTVIMVKDSEEKCKKECEAIFLGITQNPEWLEEMKTNQTLQDALAKLNMNPNNTGD